MNQYNVLMVAEKPSIALSIAQTLSNGKFTTRKGIATPIHEWNMGFDIQKYGNFTYDRIFKSNKEIKYNGHKMVNAHYMMTSVMGHIFKTDFPKQYNWSVDPLELFSAPIVKLEADPKTKITKHLKNLAKNCNIVILWLDCDREGENICFEILDVIKNSINSPKIVLRAKFSSITNHDIKYAFENQLRFPDLNEALSVDARQEIDLKVGVTFTRFQTKYFNMKYANLDSNLISYGPCQIPTLGFCVERYDSINQFRSETYYKLKVSADLNSIVKKNEIEKLGGINKLSSDDTSFKSIIHLKYKRTFKDRQSIDSIINRLSNYKYAICKDINVTISKRSRPVALNTVNLLKICSKNLRIGPYQAMNIAEHLYINGYISYPRTESTAYPSTMNLMKLLELQANHHEWGNIVKDMIQNNKIAKPKKGVDHGDHPPITPMRKVSPGELSGDELKIYEYIVRHFIATISFDAKIQEMKLNLLLDNESFEYQLNIIQDEGFFKIMPWRAKGTEDDIFESENKSLTQLQSGDAIKITSLKVEEGRTKPPSYLSESELIGLMENHSIGTDASIPVHINNIIKRNYVKLDGKNRELIPTQLGIILVHGYHKIDPDIVLPKVRSSIEHFISLIAQGKKDFQEVIETSLKLFKEKFRYFTNNIILMDRLLEASFSTVESIESSSKLKVKCGKCKRYMKFIPINPQRFYCNICEDIYNLPPKGKIKLTGADLTCPLDGFELVIYSDPKGKQIRICPNCFTNGNEFSPINKENEQTNEDTENVTKNYPKSYNAMGYRDGITCNTCLNHKCTYNYMNFAVQKSCTNCDFGTIYFDKISGHKLDCNICTYSIELPKGAKINIGQNECKTCGMKTMKFEYKDDPNLIDVCVKCDPSMSKKIKITKRPYHKPMDSKVYEQSSKSSIVQTKKEFKDQPNLNQPSKQPNKKNQPNKQSNQNQSSNRKKQYVPVKQPTMFQAPNNIEPSKNTNVEKTNSKTQSSGQNDRSKKPNYKGKKKENLVWVPQDPVPSFNSTEEHSQEIPNQYQYIDHNPFNDYNQMTPYYDPYSGNVYMVPLNFQYQEVYIPENNNPNYSQHIPNNSSQPKTNTYHNKPRRGGRGGRGRGDKNLKWVVKDQ